MSPEELRRQRDLVASHLAWLDAQLARLNSPAPSTSPAPVSNAGAPPPAPASPPAAPAPLDPSAFAAAAAHSPFAAPAAAPTATTAVPPTHTATTAPAATADPTADPDWQLGQASGMTVAEARRSCLFWIIGGVVVFVGILILAYVLWPTPSPSPTSPP